MSRLQERLDRIREAFVAQAPEQVLAVMARATEQLRASGILHGIPEVGDRLPAFALVDTEGKSVRSEQLLEGGPLVVSFYRGHW